jgi:hypothetical protein
VAESPLVQAIASASDVGALNRARLDLQRFGTPTEVLDAIRLLPSLSPDAVAWFERLRDYCFWEKQEPEPFTRATAEPEWTEYRGVGDIAGRELVVGFAGASGNVNHSSPILLQQLDATKHDLLILRDPTQEFFANGVAGTRSFDELLDRVARTAAPYRSCLTIGSSMGGGPALEAGVALGARRAVSLGGGPREGVTGRRALAESSTELWCVYSAENIRDTEKAWRLRDQYPSARLLAVPDVSDHNVTHAAFLVGTMTPLFRLLIDEHMDATVALHPTSEEGRWTVRLAPTCEPPSWTRPARARRLGASSVTRILSRLTRPAPRARRT